MQVKLETNPKAAVLSKTIGEHTYFSITRRLIMTEDLNAASRLFGGRLMEWVDEAAALFCMGQIRTRQLVTKKISEVIFNEPADLGDILEFLCRVKQPGKSSMTIECLVMTKVINPTERKRLIVQCDLVFVAIDAHGRSTPHEYNAQASMAPDFEF